VARTAVRRLAIALAAFALLATAVGVTATGGAGGTTPPATLTTSGEGSVSFTPDVASLSFGASSQRRTATAAVEANAVAMNAIVAAIKGAGAKDVSTNAVSIGPAMNQGSTAIVGFWATNAVQGSIDVGGAAKLIDAAVAAGATNVNGPSFSSSGDVEGMYRQALKAAVAQAKARAATLAAAAGLALGPLISISTNQNGATASAVATPASSPTVSTPVIAPTEQVSATVTLVYSVG